MPGKLPLGLVDAHREIAEPAPGTWGRLLSPVVGTGRWGTRPGFRACYLTLPTAVVARLSLIVTQAPELRSDCRFRNVYSLSFQVSTRGSRLSRMKSPRLVRTVRTAWPSPF